MSNHSFSPEDYFALFFGAFTIWLYARERFEHPTFVPSIEISQIVSFLRPSQLRKATISNVAFAIYLGLVLIVYFILCLPVAGPVLKYLDLFPSDGEGNSFLTITPLVVSFALVGLAPSIPFLQTVEKRVRLFSHSILGIPTYLVTGAQILNGKYIDLGGIKRGLLLPNRSWERLRACQKVSKENLEDPDDFVRDITKILLFQSWVMEQNLFRPTQQDADVRRMEQQLTEKIHRLTRELDAVLKYFLDTSASVDDVVLDQLVQLSGDADELALHICAVVMLYEERGLQSVVPDESKENKRAHEIYREFIGDIGHTARDGLFTSEVWANATIIIALASFAFYGFTSTLLFLIQYTALEPRQPLNAFMIITTSAKFSLGFTIIVSPAVLLGISYRRAMILENRWIDLGKSDVAVWLGRVAGPMIILYAAVALTLVIYNIYFNLNGEDALANFVARFFPAIQWAYLVDAARPLSHILIVFLVLHLLDLKTSRVRRGLSGFAMTVYVLLAGILGFFAQWWAETAYNLNGDFDLSVDLSLTTAEWLLCASYGVTHALTVIVCIWWLARVLDHTDRVTRERMSVSYAGGST